MPDSYSSLADDAELRRALCAMSGVRALEFHRTIDSTQRRARELAAEEGSDWTLVVADFQSAGRGQHGRRWSAAGSSSVIFSLVVRPSSPEEMALIPIRTGLAAAEAIETIAGPGVTIRLKWPNDLVGGDGKLGGILCEGQVRGADLTAIVGVGINVRPFEPEPEVIATPAYLDTLAGMPVDRLALLREVVGRIRAGLDGPPPVLGRDELARYAARDWLAGRAITDPVAGEVLGIDAHGHLLVTTAEGRSAQIVAGSVRLR